MCLTKKKQGELDPVVLAAPMSGEGIQVEIRGDSKTVVDWIDDKARQVLAGGG